MSDWNGVNRWNGINEVWPDEVRIVPRASLNSYGEAVDAPARIARAYVEPAIAMESTDQVNNLSRATTVYVDDVRVLVTDSIILPDGVRRGISKVSTYTTMEGMEHSVLTIS